MVFYNLFTLINSIVINPIGSNSSLTGGNITSSNGTAGSLLAVDEKPYVDIAALSRAGISVSKFTIIQNIEFYYYYIVLNFDSYKGQ